MNTFFLFFQGGLGALGQFLPVILIIGVFYVLLIRPQQKRQRELQETIAGLKVGDRVVTSGGIKGRITTVKDSSFVIISAEKSTLEIAKGSIAGVDSEQEKA
jgi:preprotein translocase subunit YajC